jgi:hypothetical protein
LTTSTVPSTSLFFRAETLGRIWASPPIISSYGKLQLIELISVPPCPVHCVIAGDPMSELRLRGSAAVPGTNARRFMIKDTETNQSLRRSSPNSTRFV